ncbi:hypothetical protein AB4144_53315, partial [Rhizobiaceae sp. 2RAB30]
MMIEKNIPAGHIVIRDFVDADQLALVGYQTAPRYRALYDLDDESSLRANHLSESPAVGLIAQHTASLQPMDKRRSALTIDKVYCGEWEKRCAFSEVDKGGPPTPWGPPRG